MVNTKRKNNEEWEPRESLWRSGCVIESRDRFSTGQKMESEVVVIGAGLAGILTAYMLQINGIEVVIVDGNKTGSGVTQNTTAKITSQHNLIYKKLIKDFGLEKAQQYAIANEWAIKKFRNLIQEKGIDCEFTEQSSFLYTLEDEHKDEIFAEAEAATSLGISATFLKEENLIAKIKNPLQPGASGPVWGLPFSAKAAVRFDNQAQFHPLKFLRSISKELKIYENTRVLDIEYLKDSQSEKSVVITESGNISTKHVVFACHYPFVNIPGYYFAKMHQERSYLIALSQAANVGGLYLGVDKHGYTFRNYGDLLIFGGASHRTGDNQGGGCYNSLRQAVREWYPDVKEHYSWSAQDCVTIDQVPYIGRYSSSRPEWYVATGFRKWGMTHSMVSAAIISSLIARSPIQPGVSGFLDLENYESNIYSPKRFNIPASSKNMWKDAKNISKALLKEALDIPEEKLDAIQKGHGGIVEYKGEKIGVYRDGEGRIYMVDTRCSHMSCQLAWNPDELTWDCPCHGSRFDYNGNLISGPAVTDLEKVHRD